MEKLELFLEKIMKDLPKGNELEKLAIDTEIDYKVRKEEIFEVLKRLGLDILNYEETSPEKIEEIKNLIVEKLKTK